MLNGPVEFITRLKRQHYIVFKQVALSLLAGFPPGPPGDQSLGMLGGPLELITRLRRQHGQVVGMLLGGERVVLLSEPAAAKMVLVEQADVFVKVSSRPCCRRSPDCSVYHCLVESVCCASRCVCARE
jgi:hypothetical protein